MMVLFCQSRKLSLNKPTVWLNLDANHETSHEASYCFWSVKQLNKTAYDEINLFSLKVCVSSWRNDLVGSISQNIVLRCTLNINTIIAKYWIVICIIWTLSINAKYPAATSIMNLVPVSAQCYTLVES